jgi:hypothetical protein
MTKLETIDKKISDLRLEIFELKRTRERIAKEITAKERKPSMPTVLFKGSGWAKNDLK